MTTKDSSPQQDTNYSNHMRQDEKVTIQWLGSSFKNVAECCTAINALVHKTEKVAEGYKWCGVFVITNLLDEAKINVTFLAQMKPAEGVEYCFANTSLPP